MSDFKVVITGFSSLAEAKEFTNWYSVQGEQDCEAWFECRRDEEEIEYSSMYSNTISVEGDTVNMSLELYE